MASENDACKPSCKLAVIIVSGVADSLAVGLAPLGREDLGIAVSDSAHPV